MDAAPNSSGLAFPLLDRAAFDAALDEAAAHLEGLKPRLEALAAHKRVVVYSYGVRGADLALQLRAVGIDVVVFDNAPAGSERAARAGFDTAAVLPTGLPVIVAAGQNQIEILGELGPSAYSLAGALYAYDIRNSYGRARAFSAMVADCRAALFDRYLTLEPPCRADFVDVLLYRASLDVNRMAARLPVGEMWNPPAPLDIRSFCDVGAYDGDTLKAMKALFPALRRTFTVEPNPDFDPVIAAVAANLGLTNTNYAGAAWSRRTRLGFKPLFNAMLEVGEAGDGELAADALDALTAGAAYDYVKFDVESAEAHALHGAAGLLRQAQCIAVAAYHLPNDLIDVPRQLEAILGEGWTFYFRHYSQSFDDSIFYAVRQPALSPGG
jgi:FkbM family methyltransferase